MPISQSCLDSQSSSEWGVRCFCTGKLFVPHALVAGREAMAYLRDPGLISLQPNLAALSIRSTTPLGLT